MEEKILESLNGEIKPLVRFVRFWLVAILLTNILAAIAATLIISKIGEFWAVDSRNIYRRLERLEEHHP